MTMFMLGLNDTELDTKLGVLMLPSLRMFNIACALLLAGVSLAWGPMPPRSRGC